MVARLHSDRNDRKTSDEESYRCFIYTNPSNNTWNLAQSSDAACNGLISVSEAARTFKMTQSECPSHFFARALQENLTIPQEYISRGLSSVRTILTYFNAKFVKIKPKKNLERNRSSVWNGADRDRSARIGCVLRRVRSNRRSKFREGLVIDGRQMVADRRVSRSDTEATGGPENEST